MSKLTRFIILLVTVLIAALFIMPTVRWYVLVPEADKELLKLSQAELDTNSVEVKKKVVELKALRKRSLNLGLDLQGGVNLIMEVNADDLRKQVGDTNEAEFERQYKDAVDRAILVLKNRMDQFGVAEPNIQKRFDNKVSIELPGVNNPQLIRDALSKVGKLEFRIVDEKTMEAVNASNGYRGRDYISSLSDIPDTIEIPEESEWVPYYTNDIFGTPQLAGGYILKKNIEMDGTAVRTARSDTDNFGKPEVSFELTGEGAEIFAEVTARNIKNRLAIILDGKVKSAPVIQTEITGGRGVINGNFSIEETAFLANVLKSGSLPVRLDVAEEKIIGPTLGRDSIAQSTTALIIGAGLVILFMLVYYKVSGFIAILALVFNMFFLIAFLGIMGATLTLSGIAGIALTIGMAVDANVIIFERIREEMRRSRQYRHALDNGFSHASSTIWDSNLTTLIAAFGLYFFGAGTIKGFGLTLAGGIIANIFSALFISRLIFDWILDTFRVKKISI